MFPNNVFVPMFCTKVVFPQPVFPIIKFSLQILHRRYNLPHDPSSLKDYILIMSFKQCFFVFFEIIFCT